MKKKRKSSKKFIIIISLAIVLVLVSAFALYASYNEKLPIPGLEGLYNQNSESSNSDNTQENSNLQSPETQDNNLDSNTGSIGSSGGGSGGSSSGSSGGESNLYCIERKLSYALKDMYLFSNCTQSLDGYCTSKMVTCSIEVNNLDPDSPGEFTIEYSIIDRSDNYSLIDMKQIKQNLGPKDAVYFSEVFSYSSSGEEGIANHDLKCEFETLDLPTKEVCI